MEILKCKHVRIRDPNEYDECSQEEWITRLEEEYDVDIRMIPQWRDLVKRLFVVDTDKKRRIQEAELRKKQITQKLFLEYTRPTPFELTEQLSRTAKKWERIEQASKRKKVRCVYDKPVVDSTVLSSNRIDVIHYNSPIDKSLDETDEKLSGDLKLPEIKKKTHLPLYVCTNEHKLIRPISSPSEISSIGNVEHHIVEKEPEESIETPKHITVECVPAVIRIIYNDLNRQFMQFSVINRSSSFMYIRFKKLTNRAPFKAPKIEPKYQQKMYPGLPLKYTFSFKLKDYRDQFTSQLYFRVRHGVYTGEPEELISFKIISDFKRGRVVSVPETVVIPSLYPWHFNRKETKATFQVSVDDGRDYHLHVVKRKVDLVPEFSEDLPSSKYVCLSNEDIVDKSDDDLTWTTSLLAGKRRWTKSVFGFQKVDPEYIKYYMSCIAADIVERALDTFYFECTYFPFLISNEKKVRIDVHLSKIERTGWHHGYYDFNFYDPRTEEVAVTKTMKVFVEILPHPISIEPELILIMTEAPVVHGFGQDKFVIKNSHKLYPVTVKISLTKQMKKLFRILPMETRIPVASSIMFEIKFCTIDKTRLARDYVHFNIKILVSGHKSVYHNVPPIYYEIVAPCEMYFSHLLNKPTVLVDPTELAF